MSNRFVTVVVHCAECGKSFGEANHRFVLRKLPADVMGIYSVAKFYPANPPRDEYDFPACGESCLQKLESKILSEKKPCVA